MNARVVAPAGACDTHVHIYDAGLAGGPAPPGEFPVAAYQAVQRRLGLSRVVVVQPNAYVDDNRCTLDAIARLLSLLRLLETGRCWVKLAAPYETSRTGAPLYEDVGLLAKAPVRAAPDRIVWASNWPHPSAPNDGKPDDADLLDLLLEWAPDEATRRRILVDSPAALYGF